MTQEEQGDSSGLSTLKSKLLELVTDLYRLELAAADVPGSANPNVLHDHLRRLIAQFETLDAVKSATGLSVPQDVLEYIEAGRNPNVYTRQFSEAVTRESQGMHGKMQAHADFAAVLKTAITSEFPELSRDADRAVQEVVEVPKES